MNKYLLIIFKNVLICYIWFHFQEKYLGALVAATPIFALRQSSAWGMSDSSLSIDSLLLAAENPLAGGTLTPEVARRSNPFNKAMGTIGYSLYNC